MEYGQELPRYMLIKPLYADDTFFDEESIIDYDGIPNEYMQPLNEPAIEAMKAYVEKLMDGLPTPPLADTVERAYQTRPRREITPIIPRQPQYFENGMPIFREDIPHMPGVRVDGKPIPERQGKKTASAISEGEKQKYRKPKRIIGSVQIDSQQEHRSI